MNHAAPGPDGEHEDQRSSEQGDREHRSTPDEPFVSQGDPVRLPALPSYETIENVWETRGIAERYAEFATAHWYQSLNRELVEVVSPTSSDVVVDLGSGTGNLSRALAAARGGSGKVIGIDSSHAMLQKAIELTRASTGVEFREGLAEDLLTLVPEPIHHVTAANSIHLFDDLVAVMLAAHRKLPHGGSFSFSSAFTKEASSESSQSVVPRLIRTLKLRINEQQADLQENSDLHESTGSRNKIVRLDNEAILQQMLVLGFKELSHTLVETEIPQASLVSFFTLPGIGNALFPPAMDTDTRTTLVHDVLHELGVTSLSRNWAFFRGVKA